MACVIVSLLIVGLGVPNAAMATLVDGVTASTSMGTFSTYCLPCLTNGVGLSSLSLAATHDASYPNMWMSNAQVAGTLTFDLGAVNILADIGIWNYNYGGLSSRGVRTMSIDVSFDDVVYTPVLGPTVIPQSAGGPVSCHVINLSSVNARYVRFNIIDNYGDSYTGLSEVQFNTAGLVPVRTATWGEIKGLFK